MDLLNLSTLMGGVFFLVAAIVIVVAVMVSRTYRRKAHRAGYESLGEYLRAAPRSDEEKRDAVNLALKGLIICRLGLVFPPFLLHVLARCSPNGVVGEATCQESRTSRGRPGS